MSPCMTCWVQIITNVSILSKIRKKKNNDKLTQRLDSAKSVGMITWYEETRMKNQIHSTGYILQKAMKKLTTQLLIKLLVINGIGW